MNNTSFLGYILDIREKTISFNNAIRNIYISPEFHHLETPIPNTPVFSDIYANIKEICRWTEDVTEEVAIKALNEGKPILVFTDDGRQTLLEIYDEYTNNFTDFPISYFSCDNNIIKIHVCEVNANEI